MSRIAETFVITLKAGDHDIQPTQDVPCDGKDFDVRF
jgi:hypothetical protein